MKKKFGKTEIIFFLIMKLFEFGVPKREREMVRAGVDRSQHRTVRCQRIVNQMFNLIRNKFKKNKN